MADTAATWKKRVASWRASGETAEAFSRGRGWSAHTLRWWASRLGREANAQAPGVRFARLVRSAAASTPASAGHAAIVIDWLDARVRVTVEAGVERDTLAAVLELIRPGTDR